MGSRATAARTRVLAAVGGLALAAVAAGVDELAVIFGAGVLAALVAWTPPGRAGRANGLSPCPGARRASPRPRLARAVQPTSLFLVFLKIGSVLFGSGYVLLAFLRADLVVRRGWLTEGQLLDAVAVGQVTPGPVFTTATFVGYSLGGFGGAVVATGDLPPGLRVRGPSGPSSPGSGAPRDGGVPRRGERGFVALMALVTAHLARAVIVDPDGGRLRQ